MRVLFTASEAYPFIKTGGLADVACSLPQALHEAGVDVRLVLPAYSDIMLTITEVENVGSFEVIGKGVKHEATLLRAVHKETRGVVYLIDVPRLYNRPGNPYMDPEGAPYADNMERFTVFSRGVAILSEGFPGDDWKPDIVHCNDWQTALVPAFISENKDPAKTVYTIHNMAYDGCYSYYDFQQLSLPYHWWTSGDLEFHGEMSMMKAGIIYADRVNTVSPTYAKEIMTEAFGYRYYGLLQHHADKVSGILNGIDDTVWNPRVDPFIKVRYSTSRNRIEAKADNKRDLLEKAGLSDSDAPLIGFIGRLVEQKGVDLMLETMPAVFDKTDARYVIIGSGEAQYETALLDMADRYPDRVSVFIGYSEEFAHQIEAGCDMFMMPSKFEPCGLNQMYSLRYGTPPIVNWTGGLADTVVDTNLETLRDITANGFVFHDADPTGLLEATLTATQWYERKRLWQQICRTGMQADFGWDGSAQAYIELYENI